MERLLNRNKKSRTSYVFSGLNIILFLLLLTGGVFFHLQQSASQTAFYHKELQNNATEIESHFDAVLDRYRRSMGFIANTPPISGLHRAEVNAGVDPLDGTEYQQWVNRLETIFTSYMQFNPDIDQLRVIKASGVEEIRVERVEGQISPASDLQDKSDRGYFNNAMQLPRKKVYISAIELNKEYGEVEYPIKPVIRFAMPLYNGTDEPWGILVLNLKAQPLLNKMQALLEPPEQLILVNSADHFILHPDSNLMFSQYLAEQHTFSTAYQQSAEQGTNLSVLIDKAGNELLGLSRQLKFGFDDGQVMQAVVMLPKKALTTAVIKRDITFYSVRLLITSLLDAGIIFYRRMAQKSSELAEAQQLAGSIVNQSFDAILSVDENGDILSCNQAAEDLLQVSAANVVGEPVSSLAAFHDFDVKKAVAGLANANNKHRILDWHIPSTEKSDDKQLTLSLSMIAPKAGASHLAIIIRDVTAQIQAEAEIKQMNQFLEQEVAERTKELKQARDEAQKSSEIKSQFISSISHEIRTPLNGVIGGLKLLRNEPQTSKAQHYIDLIDTSTDALGVLINDVLDLSKIEAGKLELVATQFSAKDLVESLCKSMAIKAYEKGLELFIDVSGVKSAQVEQDKNRLSQILNNLINNACKFTHKGYIAVKVWEESLPDNHCHMCISVTDTGIGISEQQQHKLFESFSQASPNIAAQYGGTGLGLSISRQLAIMLGGDIKFTSVQGRGSEFTVSIKVKQVEADIVTTKPLKQQRIAICAENKHVESWLRDTLESLGASVFDSDSLPSDGDDTHYQLKEVDAFIAEQECLISSPFYQAIQTEPADDLPHVILLTAPGEELQFKYRDKPVTQLNKPVAITDLLKLLTGSKHRKHSDKQEEVEQQVSNLIIKKITGAKVMIVDDNETNLAIAKGALESLPITIKTACNGLEAVDKLKKMAADADPCHCILMDCQMPILSGYDATHRIRSGKAGSDHENVAVVAMTASAMSGEREKCIASGMDHYITKPIDFNEVQQVVTEYLTKNYTAKQQSVAVPSTVDSDELAAAVAWDKQSALQRLRGKTELFKQICQLFVDRVPEKITELETAMNTESYDDVRKASHALKGMCSDIGANQVASVLQEIETGATKGIDTQELSDMQIQAVNLLWQLREIVEHYVQQ